MAIEGSLAVKLGFVFANLTSKFFAVVSLRSYWLGWAGTGSFDDDWLL